MIIFSACKKPETEADLMASIAEAQSQIEEMIQPQQCATIASDCRIRDIMSGSGCGPTYIYNIEDVNASELDSKFSELEKLQRRYNETGKDISCFRFVPNTVYVEDCKCEAEFRMPGQ